MNIINAVQNRNVLTFVYDGFMRTVEPHTYGTDTKGHLALRAYQVAGGSESNQYVGWKLFHVHEMASIIVQSQTFAGPRTGYKRDDKAFVSILAQL